MSKFVGVIDGEAHTLSLSAIKAKVERINNNGEDGYDSIYAVSKSSNTLVAVVAKYVSNSASEFSHSRYCTYAMVDENGFNYGTFVVRFDLAS